MIRSNSKVWQTLADASETPGEFIRNVLALRNMNCSDVARQLDVTPAYIMMMKNGQNVPDTAACLRLARALNIDPYILNRKASEYRLKKLIEKEQDI